MLSDEEASMVLRDIGAMFALYAKPVPSAPLLNILLDDIESFGLPVIQKAMKRLRVTYDGRSPITSALLIGACESVCGRLTGDEAWSLALRVRDESKTLVWTDEIARAWGMAAELLRGRADLVGARRAFLDAYERICHNKREARALPRAEVTLGLDGDSHAVALDQARELGIDVAPLLLPESVLCIAIEKAGGAPVLGVSPVELRLGFDPGSVGPAADKDNALRAKNLELLRVLRERIRQQPKERRDKHDAHIQAEHEKWNNLRKETQNKTDAFCSSIQKQTSKQKNKKASKQAI